jgi:hypothetical protein
MLALTVCYPFCHFQPPIRGRSKSFIGGCSDVHLPTGGVCTRGERGGSRSPKQRVMAARMKWSPRTSTSQSSLFGIFFSLLFSSSMYSKKIDKKPPSERGTQSFFRFADLPQMWQFAICRPHIFCNLRICDLQTHCELKTSANPQKQKFSPYKYKLQMLSLKYKNEFWL